MDSRHYRFVFPVNTKDDIPQDFFVSDQNRRFDRGLFIPQDDKRWFTERPAYPARLLLLQDNRLSVITHPSAREGEILLSLADIREIETGRSLLAGWIRFKTQCRNDSILYNTRASEDVDLFVAVIRKRWLESYCPLSPPGAWKPRGFGAEPDLKFRNMLSEALDVDEFVLLQYFVEHRERRERIWGIRRSSSFAGHLVAITSQNRLLWLHDEYRGRWSPYSGIAISAPLCLLRKADYIEQQDHHSILELEFANSLSWRIHLENRESEGNSFLKALQNTSAARTGSRAQDLSKLPSDRELRSTRHTER